MQTTMSGTFTKSNQKNTKCLLSDFILRICDFNLGIIQFDIILNVVKRRKLFVYKPTLNQNRKMCFYASTTKESFSFSKYTKFKKKTK